MIHFHGLDEAQYFLERCQTKCPLCGGAREEDDGEGDGT